MSGRSWRREDAGRAAAPLLLPARRLLRPLRALPLRADDGDLHPLVPGPAGRPHLPDERDLADLVLRPLRPAADRRLRRLVPALDPAGAARDRADGRDLVPGRPRLPPPLCGCWARLLPRDR